MTLSIGIKKLSIETFNKMTLNQNYPKLIIALDNDTKHKDTQHYNPGHTETQHNDIQQNDCHEMTLSITTLWITTLNVMTCSIMTFWRATLNIATLSIANKLRQSANRTYYPQCYPYTIIVQGSYDQCRKAECRYYKSCGAIPS
jgi:hypothetical protein